MIHVVAFPTAYLSHVVGVVVVGGGGVAISWHLGLVHVEAVSIAFLGNSALNSSFAIPRSCCCWCFLLLSLLLLFLVVVVVSCCCCFLLLLLFLVGGGGGVAATG